MPTGQFTGRRIRERRLAQGLRQAELAQMAGISPSYLNLIEHNRRRIAGRLLNDIARALEVDPQSLAEGAEAATVEALRRAAARPETRAAAEQVPELDRIDDFAGRFPGWAALIVGQERRLVALEDRLRGLTDRLAYDPQLAAALHDVISSVTSIHSTASILAGDEEVDADWQRRFHLNIAGDAQRLADSSQALVRYLDATSGDRAMPQTPTEEVDNLVEAHSGTFPAIEAEGLAAVAPVLEASGAIVSEAGRGMAQRRLTQYAEDAARLPLAMFGPLALELRHDPVALARRTGAALDQVMRRLAALPPEGGHPMMGLVICDSAGVVTAVQPFAGVDWPRTGGACPLWPVFQALGQPGRPIRARVELPGAHDLPLLIHAVAVPRIGPDYEAAVVHEATMLFRSAPDPLPAGLETRPVGIACRICPRAGCAARREPSFLASSAAG